MSDFNLYTDQLAKLKHPEAEETLVDTFLDSILDPKYDVAKSLCKQLKYNTVAQCMEAVRFHNNAAIRDHVTDHNDTLHTLRAKIRRLQDGRKSDDSPTTPLRDEAPPTGPGKYHSYKDWQALTSEQKKTVLIARGTKRTARRVPKENTAGASTPGTPRDLTGHEEPHTP